MGAFDAAVSLVPTDAGSLFNRGNAADKAGRRDEAASAFGAALALEPNDKAAAFNQANALAALGRNGEAEARSPVQKRPRPCVVGAAAAYEMSHSKGALAHATAPLRCPSRYLSPQARFRLAVRLDAAYQPAYANLGLALASQARHIEAAAAHRQALALEPRDTASAVGLGDALRSGGDAAAAARAYRAALALAPGAAEAYTGLAHTLKGSDPVAASAAFESAALGDQALRAEAERLREWLRDVPPGRARGAAELVAASRYPALFEDAPRCAEAEMSEAVAQGAGSLSQVNPSLAPMRTLYRPSPFPLTSSSPSPSP